ncbi:hypothetical protein LP420_11245 [Massilia sp. B-10]|nr:hypothetical protein LP420_11245 [Massilia sp. B-10]
MYFTPNLTQFKSITINWEPHGHVLKPTCMTSRTSTSTSTPSATSTA